MGSAPERGLASQPTMAAQAGPAAGGSADAGVSVLGDTMSPSPPRPEDLPPNLAPTLASAQAPTLATTGKFPVAGWGRYEFQKLLGRGGMGAVYKARDPRLDRMIALKFIYGSDDQTILRFMQEARAQARIDHPGICKIPVRRDASDGSFQPRRSRDPFFDPAPPVCLRRAAG